MDERRSEQGPPSRRAALRALPTPADVELVQDAPPLLEVMGDLPEPRVSELEALLREVDELRGSMRRDLSLAATAAEAGADDLAGWLLLSEDGQIRTFEDRALAHLQELQARELLDEADATALDIPAPRRSRRMLPAAPMVAACAALFGFLTGSVPGLSGGGVTSPETSSVALDSYARLTDLAANGASDSSLTAAAQKFHNDLAPLVAAASTNPEAAEKALALLRSERAVFAAGVDSPELRAVLRQADLLVARLQASLPRKPLRPTVVLPAPQRQQESRPTSSPAAKSPAPSPSASPKPSPQPTPVSSPKPSPAPSASNPLPGSPLQQ